METDLQCVSAPIEVSIYEALYAKENGDLLLSYPLPRHPATPLPRHLATPLRYDQASPVTMLIVMGDSNSGMTRRLL